MNRTTIESTLRILIAHRNSRPMCERTRAAIHSTIAVLKAMRT
jgi:hypothetical protein